MRSKVSPLVSECELFEIRQTVHFFPSRVALCGSSVSPSKSDCPLFEIQKVDTSKFGSVHFSDATLERKKWTVEISGVSTFLTLPVREKSGQLRFQNFLSPLFVGVSLVQKRLGWVGG